MSESGPRAGETVSGYQIRDYRAGDLEAARSLVGRVEPYLPEDEPAVAAMHAAAESARLAGDRWVPLPPELGRLGDVESGYLGFWLAETTDAKPSVIGMIGVRRAGSDLGESGELPFALEWRRRGDVAELRRLRVAPEWHRRGVGSALTATALAWARSSGFAEAVLNTTTAQSRSLALYYKLGFREVARSFVGRYGLVWLALRLTVAGDAPSR